MRRKAKDKNYDTRQEKLAACGHASTRKLNIPSKHTADTNLWGVPLLETTTRDQHTQPLIDRYDCTGKKELSSDHYSRFLLSKVVSLLAAIILPFCLHAKIKLSLSLFLFLSLILQYKFKLFAIIMQLLCGTV